MEEEKNVGKKLEDCEPQGYVCSNLDCDNVEWV